MVLNPAATVDERGTLIRQGRTRNVRMCSRLCHWQTARRARGDQRQVMNYVLRKEYIDFDDGVTSMFGGRE